MNKKEVTMFPSPKLGLSLKLMLFVPLTPSSICGFPSPKLGLSLKFKSKFMDNLLNWFPSPKLGLSLKLKALPIVNTDSVSVP